MGDGSGGLGDDDGAAMLQRLSSPSPPPLPAALATTVASSGPDPAVAMTGEAGSTAAADGGSATMSAIFC